MAQKLNLRCLLGPRTLGAGAKNTSRIQNKEVYATSTLYLQVVLFTWDGALPFVRVLTSAATS